MPLKDARGFAFDVSQSGNNVSTGQNENKQISVTTSLLFRYLIKLSYSDITCTTCIDKSD